MVPRTFCGRKNINDCAILLGQGHLRLEEPLGSSSAGLRTPRPASPSASPGVSAAAGPAGGRGGPRALRGATRIPEKASTTGQILHRPSDVWDWSRDAQNHSKRVKTQNLAKMTAELPTRGGSGNGTREGPFPEEALRSPWSSGQTADVWGLQGGRVWSEMGHLRHLAGRGQPGGGARMAVSPPVSVQGHSLG